jgi:hypothetical protein
MTAFTIILLFLVLGLLFFLIKKLSDLTTKIEKISQILDAKKDAGAIRPQVDDGTPPKEDPNKPKPTA